MSIFFKIFNPYQHILAALLRKPFSLTCFSEQFYAATLELFFKKIIFLQITKNIFAGSLEFP